MLLFCWLEILLVVVCIVATNVCVVVALILNHHCYCHAPRCLYCSLILLFLLYLLLFVLLLLLYCSFYSCADVKSLMIFWTCHVALHCSLLLLLFRVNLRYGWLWFVLLLLFFFLFLLVVVVVVVLFLCLCWYWASVALVALVALPHVASNIPIEIFVVVLLFLFCCCCSSIDSFRVKNVHFHVGCGWYSMVNKSYESQNT